MRGRGLGHGLWVLAFGLVLAPYRPPERAVVPGGVVAEVEQSLLVPTLFVDIRKPVLPEVRRAAETTGHILLFVETFLADVPGVVPRLDGVPGYPGFSRALPPEGGPWTVSLTVSIAEDVITVDLEGCDPDGACETHHGEGSRLQPNAVVGELITALASRMGRDVTSAREGWITPLTRDDYAVLMAGRGAAIYYGYLPPVAPESRGDNRKDPIARAVFLDPKLPGSWSLVARTVEDPGRRLIAWKTASELAPQNAALKAAYAAAFDEEGLLEPAWTAWTAVAAIAPNDLRFLIPRARAALRVNQMKEVERTLALVPARFSGDGLIASMNVAVADAKGGASDALLTAWQSADPTNAEPVRRRIALYVTAHDFDAALKLTEELASRGAPEEAWRLTVALASDLGQYGLAAQAAERLGQADLGHRLAGRAQPDPALRAGLLTGSTLPAARLVRADALLHTGKAAEARAEVEKLLKERPWWPEALDLHARALSSLGQEKLAAESRSRVLQADPLYFEASR